ncbi:hypothetical protein K439DRAFT_1241850, partial [Ramaria rubella]
SEVYAHFKMPPEIKISGDNIKYLFICKSNPSKSVTHSCMDDLTSNLVAHKTRCAPEQVTGSSSIKSFVHGSTYSYSQMRYLLTLWVARCHQPYAIVQDAELLQILQMLYELVDVPSARTLSWDVQEVFLISQCEVTRVLQAYDGKLHLGVDGWAAPNVFSFLRVTVTRCVSGDLITIILDFIR